MKTVLITGASKGIGRAIALRLAADGFTIVIHYNSDLTGAEGTLRDAGNKGRLIHFDTQNRDLCQQAIEQDIKLNGPYWGAVLNAGIADDNAFPAMSPEQWDRVIHTNLDGFYNTLHPIIMPMVSARLGGRIVTLSSVSGIVGNRGQVNYSAAKAGIIGATKALAVELAKRSITVNCVAPGLIETQMTKDVMSPEIINTIPMRRAGKPDEVAGLVGFLFSQEAAYITRQVISVNGGLV